MTETKQQAAQKGLNTIWMVVLAFIVGLVGGFGAILFRMMIGFVHNLGFAGKLSFEYSANVHTPASYWGVGIILVPVIGAIIVTWITQTFAKEAKGHGVPEVMDAIYYGKGKIRPAVAIVKAIASAISIGTGGSVGREGPIIQIGAAFGSTLGQIISKISHRQRIVLIAAGGAAGIAATFNAPIGGLAFAIELLLITISAVNVALVAIATVTATMTSQIILGLEPSFFVKALAAPLHHAISPLGIAMFVPFGLLMGASAALFIHSIYWAEDFFDATIKNPYVRHSLGMLGLGIMFYVLITFTGHYYVDGVGYATILEILRGVLSNPWLLLLLFVCKLLATSLTLGSGASGGVFSPSLFLGATLGSAFAVIVNHIFPGLHIEPSMFAVAGMAAMVAGSTGAVLTAIIMTFEQTRDYADILPIMITVALAYAIRVRITAESIYTLKLFRRGRMIPQGLQAAMSVNKRARHIMTKEFATIKYENVREYLETETGTNIPRCIVVIDGDEIKGVIRQEMSYLRSDVDTEALIDPNFSMLSANTTWPSIVRTMHQDKVAVMLVTNTVKAQKSTDIVGVITQLEISESSHETASLLD